MKSKWIRTTVLLALLLAGVAGCGGRFANSEMEGFSCEVVYGLLNSL